MDHLHDRKGGSDSTRAVSYEVGNGAIGIEQTETRIPPPLQFKSRNSTSADENPEPAALGPVTQLDTANADGNENPSDDSSKPNNTGLPNNLKSGIENLSGFSLDDVKVHYNSEKPAQLKAHAYAQGTEIHLSPGQEKHLPHEAWHVVQQKQGRVQPTLQMKAFNINTDTALEKEADEKGAKAGTVNSISSPSRKLSMAGKRSSIIQAMSNELTSIGEGEVSTSEEAIVIGGSLYLIEGKTDLAQVQMTTDKIGHGASLNLGKGSFIKFQQGSQELTYNTKTYHQIIPKFQLTKSFEAGSPDKARLDDDLAAADAGQTSKRYWSRTYDRNKDGKFDDSIFEFLFTDISDHGDLANYDFLHNPGADAHQNLVTDYIDHYYPTEADFFARFPADKFSDQSQTSSQIDDTPMAGPADCETFSALAQGALSKRNRRFCYSENGEDKLLPETEDTSKEYSALTPFRNQFPRNVGDKAVNLLQSPAQSLVDEMFYKTVLNFINKAENDQYLNAIHKRIPDNPIHPSSKMEFKIQDYYELKGGVLGFSDKFKGPEDLTVCRGIQTIKDLYWGLSEEGRKKFDKEHGINQYANPTAGEAFMMATQDDAPGFTDYPDAGTWSMHWGTVILDLGHEKVTLEGYAEQGNQTELRRLGVLGNSEMYQVRRAIFGMYSGINTATGEPYEPDKTFQKRHLASRTHGTAAVTGKVVME